jgi:formylglycine-generating enzyme required for sulfatase activity
MSAELSHSRRRKRFLGGSGGLALALSMQFHCAMALALTSPSSNEPAPAIGAGRINPRLAQAPQSPAPRPASPPVLDEALETRFWNSIKDSDRAGDLRLYLDAFPDGRYAALARAKLQQITGKKSTPASDVIRDCPECPELALIPAGTFNMGSTEMFPFEGPVHQVTIGKAFYLGRREVSVDEWKACVIDGGCADRPASQADESGTSPATNLDWNDAQHYVAWLTRKNGQLYRLPSESEWEYSARAGTVTPYYWGKTLEKDRANCLGCTSERIGKATPAGTYPANNFGLYDMAGNAAEWVQDCWNDSYKLAPADGSAWNKPRCQERVLRGGSFNNDPRYMRSAARFKYDFDVRYYTNGFRVLREK